MKKNIEKLFVFPPEMKILKKSISAFKDVVKIDDKETNWVYVIISDGNAITFHFKDEETAKKSYEKVINEYLK